MPEKSVLDSKEKQIKKLNENIKNLEVEYDNILQQKDKEKMRADKLERDSKPVNAKIEQLEADLKHALKMNDSQENNLEKDIVMFNQVNCQSSLQQPFSQTIQTAQSLNSWSGLLSKTFYLPKNDKKNKQELRLEHSIPAQDESVTSRVLYVH